MSSISIEVKGDAGASCLEIIEDMCRLANLLNIRVDCDLNGVTTMAQPLCDPKALKDAWHEEFVSNGKYRVCCGHPVIAFTGAAP